MTTSSTISPGVAVDRDGPVTVLTLRNPAKRNALSPVVVEALGRAVEAAGDDPACRAIVMTGADGTFCSGGDIATFAGLGAPGARRFMEDCHRFIRRLIQGEKPTIAAVEGAAYGGGFGLALACDQVVASRDARFAAAFTKLGLVPDMALAWTLPQRAGLGLAKDLSLTAREVRGEEALALGLVDELAEPGQALAAAVALGRRFAEFSPNSLALTKAMLGRWPLSLEDELAYEAECQGLLFASEDLQEGRAAFLDKRKPVFQGR